MKSPHCLHIVFVFGMYTAIYFFGGLRFGWISMGTIFLGEGNFRGVNILGQMLDWGICKNYYTKFFLNVLYSLDQTFHAEIFQGNSAWAVFRCFVY